MSTITAVLEPGFDGTLHLPLPGWLSGGKFKVVATVEPAESPAPLPFKIGCLKGFQMAPDFDAPLADFQPYSA